MILEHAINHTDKCKILISIFNDENPEYVQTLEKNINQLSGYEKLRYSPRCTNYKMDTNLTIIDNLNLERKLVPTLFFIDPFGFKGLYLRLIFSVLKDWGSDGIFFFNYQRVNRAISNPPMKTHMEFLFGKLRLENLKTEVRKKPSRQREEIVLKYLSEAIKGIGGKYVLDFRFPKFGELKTSHYIIFVSKNIKGYKAMKEILAKYSNSDRQGVASFEFDPSIEYTSESLLPGFDGPLDILETSIFEHFQGKERYVSEIYAEHDIGSYETRYYTFSNYQQALLNLEKKGKIKVDKDPSKRMRMGKLTLGEKRKITFRN